MPGLQPSFIYLVCIEIRCETSSKTLVWIQDNNYMRISPVRELLIKTLKELGPMTAAELTEATGLKRNQVDTCLVGTRKAYPKKYFIIRGWHRNYGLSGRMAPIYGYGNGPDVKPPAPDDSKARNARWRDKHRAILRVRGNQVRGSDLVSDPFAQLITLATTNKGNTNSS